MSSVRWNIAVSPDMDQSVRMFIAAKGGGRKGDLCSFPLSDRLFLSI